jgi:hypothetical protein
MSKNIEPSLKLIGDYLKLKKNENFVVPEYQRGYSWDITQCDKLWQDIDAFIFNDEHDDPYFFGTIIVDCSESNKFSLIDGQQRTITFFLLLKAILLRLNEIIPNIPDDEESEPLKAGLKANRNKIMTILYKADDEDIPLMLKDNSKIKNITILENNSINELYLDEAKKIIEAVNFNTSEQNVCKIPRKQNDNKYTRYFRNFKFFYKKLNDKTETQLNKFAKKFLNECQVIEIRSWQVEQAITMFNSLNSTGLPLTDADIISAQLYSNSKDKKEDFNKKWKQIKELADELSNRKIIDINGILQQFMYINRAIDEEYISKKEDGNESVDVTTPGLRRYYTEIKNELLLEPFILCDNLLKIAILWDKVKDYPIIKLLLKFNENAKLFISGYLFRFEIDNISEEILLDISESLIRLFTILELTDYGYSNSKFKTFLFGENIKIVKKNVPIKEIKKDFDQHIKNNWDPNSIKQDIIEYNKNILVYLNEYLYSKIKNVKFDFTENVNIEHIMPASGHNLKTIQQDAEISNNEEFSSIVNSLGNKILLEEAINKSISNEWFKTKKQTSIKNKTGYKDSKYAIASNLTKYPSDNWTKEDINKATQKAAERIIKFIFNT